MKAAWTIRVSASAAVLAATWWLVAHTSWIEVEEAVPPSGAATLPYYSLGQVARAAGTALERRTALEPMPPRTATLLLRSMTWDLFPERDEALRRWVEAGGRLVVLARPASEAVLRWLPPALVPRARPAGQPASTPAADGQRPAARHDADQEVCEIFVETLSGAPPAFEPGRGYRRCLTPAQYATCVDRRLVPSPRARPEWTLGDAVRTYAMRVPYGRGSVTTLADCLPVNNDAVPRADHALIDAAVLGMRPGATVWILDEEAGEPLRDWLWNHARAPSLLAAAAIVLALWRLMVRFGPRRAGAPAARRSMGEQVRGTGRFIAATDMPALHAATRRAFDDAARTRIEGWNDLDDTGRLEALADAGAAFDRPALLAAFAPGAQATPAQWLAATAVIEQARRALPA